VRSGFTPLHLGVITESVLNRTLSGIEEDGARISQRPKPLLKRLGWPDVVAIEANVLPAERGNVGEQLIRQRLALGAKLCNGTAEVDGVPKDDGGDREVEARGTVALIFEGTVPDFAVTMEKQGAGERVSGLALVETGIGTASERRI
jgi:hypothetical protein